MLQALLRLRRRSRGRLYSGARLLDAGSSLSRTAWLPHSGQISGKRKGLPPSAGSATTLDDLRDDVAGALHDDGVAVAHVLAGDLVLVVQRRVRYDDAADRDRPQLATGVSEPVRPTWISIAEHGRRLLGRELVGDRPAGERETKPSRSCIEAVDLVDDAVDVVAKARAFARCAVIGEEFGGRGANAQARIGRAVPSA